VESKIGEKNSPRYGGKILESNARKMNSVVNSGLNLHAVTMSSLFLFSFAGSSLPSSEEELKDWLAYRWKVKEQILTKFYSSGSFETSSICNKDSKYSEASAINLSNGSFSQDSQVVHRNSVTSLPSIVQNSSYDSSHSSNHLKVCCRYDAAFNHLPSHEKSRSSILYLTLIFWTLLCFIALYGILTSFIIQVFAIMNISLFLFLSFFTQGFHLLEISLYRFKTKSLAGRSRIRGK
jgi:hypothetical protein